jgi:peptidoglycan/xylan/chitin deacetylase (PgdA/CDA1 family)
VRSLSLKVDVCTHDGMRDGVPRLLDLLAKHDVKASFFLSFGPDYAGRAVFNVFRRGFLRKMLKSGAPSLYGFRTMVSGTLLPARMIAARYPDLVRRIDGEGHEVAVHAWNHRRWQDRLGKLSETAIREEFDRAFASFEEILGRPARAFGAAAWFVTPASLAVADGLGLSYASDLRGGPPCRPRSGERTFETLQIPTTGPCIEELLVTGVRDEDAMAATLLEKAAGPDLAVMAVHAEVEGGPYLGFFERLLPRLRDGADTIRPLRDVAAEIEDPPVRDLRFTELPGRSGRVATTGSPLP